MKVQWNNCFLCLNDLDNGRGEEETASKKRRKVRKCIGKDAKPIRADTAVLLNYLLYTKCKKYSGLIDNVVELIKHEETTEKSNETSSSHDTVSVRFCDECEAHMKTVSELHQQLEVVQMKLVHVLRSLQSTVVWNSKKSNGGESRGVGLDIFEDWLTEQERGPLEDGESQLKEQRKILDTLYAFQEAVIENVRNSLVIPMVFLDKIAKFKPHHNVNSSEVVIKTEGVDFDENLDNVPSPEEPDWFSENLDDDPPKPIPTGRKRKTKKTKFASSVEVKLKNESDDEEFLPRKKVRSASSSARLRISATQKTKPKQAKNKKQKTEAPTKIRGETLQPFRLMPHSRKPNKSAERNPSCYWACATCPFVSENKYCFEHHLRTHEVVIGEDATTSSTTPLFHCDKCENLSFSVQQNYQFHQACHEGAVTMHCDVCNVACEPFALVEHMKTHLETVPKLYPCPNCSHCCSKREKYIQHLKYHRSKDGAKLECDICREEFPFRTVLLDHYHKMHQLLESLTCDEDGCKKEFFDPDDLRRHQRNFHKNSCVCQHCGKVLSSTRSLEQHLLQHTGDKPFACTHCPERFPYKANLNRHLVSQHEAPKVKCEYCQKEYAEKRNLKIHIAQAHTGSGFVCDFPQCGKSFGNVTGLKRHTTTIHSNERNFSCEECGQQFKLAQTLKKHLLIHYGEKKFKCQYCDKAFLHEKYLTTHVRIHTGEKPFICHECGSAFNQYASLYMHKRKCHLGN